MRTFLIVILCIFGGIFLLGLMARWWLMRKLKLVFGKVMPFAEGMAQLAELAREAMDVTLRPAAEGAAGGDPRRFREAVDGFRREGFQEAGLFTCEAVPGTLIAGLADPSRSAYAIVYDSAHMGVHAEVDSIYPDGSVVTHSSASRAVPPPGAAWLTVRSAPGAGAAELLRLHLAERPPSPEGADTAQFEAVFLDIFRRSLLEVAHQGFQARAIEALGSVGAGGPDGRDAARLVTNLAMHAAAEEQIIQAWAAGMGEDEREEVRHRLFAVHEGSDVEELVGRLMEPLGLGWDESDERVQELREGLESGDKRQAMTDFLSRHDPAGRIEWLAEVESPVQADIYMGPEGRG